MPESFEDSVQNAMLRGERQRTTLEIKSLKSELSSRSGNITRMELANFLRRKATELHANVIIENAQRRA